MLLPLPVRAVQSMVKEKMRSIGRASGGKTSVARCYYSVRKRDKSSGKATKRDREK
jgi:hypothetical protein